MPLGELVARKIVFSGATPKLLGLGLWMFSLLFSYSSSAQVDVLNGLSHVHRWAPKVRGKIELVNGTSVSQTVVLSVEPFPKRASGDFQWFLDTLVEISREVTLLPYAKIAIPYSIYRSSQDTVQRALAAMVYVEPLSGVQRMGQAKDSSWHVQSYVRYGIALFSEGKSPASQAVSVEVLDSAQSFFVELHNPTDGLWFVRPFGKVQGMKHWKHMESPVGELLVLPHSVRSFAWNHPADAKKVVLRFEDRNQRAWTWERF